MTINLTIDGMAAEAREGSSILEVINAAGVYVPQLCKDPAMPAIGACRTCLVQVEGRRGFPASCHTPVSEGMVVHTNSPEVRRIRQGILDLTLGMLPTETPGEPLAEHKELKTASKFHDLLSPGYEPRTRDHTDVSNPFFSVEMDDCIMCGRCVEACQSLQEIGAIAILGRGQDAFIGTYADEPIGESICTSCGSCVAACPTGAIEPKLSPANAVKQTSTVCPYCGVGCGILLNTDANDKVLWVDDDPNNQSSLGKLCVKGRFGVTFVNHGDRLTTPLIRKNGKLTPASWDEALDLTADKAGRAPGGDRRPRFRQGDQRGRLHPPEVHAHGDGHQQHRPLHSAVPLAVGGGDAEVSRERGDQQLLSGLRKGGLPDHRRV